MQSKTFGSSLIVAGTTIGAGMLAMPLTSAQMGFTYTIALLIALWGLLAFSALLFVEVYQKAPRPNAGIATLAEQYFGLPGRIITTIASLLLMYALLSAYAIGGGNLLSPFITFFSSYQESIGIICFLTILAITTLMGTKVVDNFTCGLFILKLIAFAAMVFMMFTLVKVQYLKAMPLNYWLILSASPIFFTSYGFHVVIPTINNYLNNDIRHLRKAILIGTAIPLFAYILWEFVTHGIFSQSEFVQIIRQDPTLNGLVEASYRVTGSAIIGYAIQLFSAFALVTSFLGVALSLVDCLDDLLDRKAIKTNRFCLTLLAFSPVLIISLFYRNFLDVLTYAGQIFVYYGLLLPIGLAWMFRKKYPHMPYRVLGGKLSLISAFIVGVIIFTVPWLMQYHYLPSLH